MQAGNDQRGVDEAEDCPEDHLEGTGDPRVDHGGDSGADLPADGTQDEMGRHHRQQQAAEGNDDHTDDRGRDFAEELFQIDQGERRQDRGDDLGLIADHIYLEEAEVPTRDGLGGGHGVGVEQLSGHQGQAQHNAQHLGGAHLSGDRPADPHRQHVEHRLADEPEEAVQPGPELAEVTQGLGAVLEEVEAVDTVAEAQDQAPGDQGGDEGGEDLRQRRHDPLGRVLVLLGGLFHLVLGHALHAGHRHEVVVEVGDRVADDHLELSRLGEGAFGHFHGLDTRHVRLFGVVEYKSHPCDTVGNCRDVLLPAYQLQQPGGVLLILTHSCIPPFCSTCLNKL